MFGRLMKIFIDCSEKFVNNESELILSGVSERCLCGSFMLIIKQALKQTEFSPYYTDIEYNRNFDGQIKTIIDNDMEVINITCDLIVHSRGQIPENDNLIAIEMKRDNHPEAEKNKDRIRLKALTKPTNDSMTYSYDGRTLPQHVCGYKVGVFYEINITERQIRIEYYQNGESYDNYIRTF
jgi:hypothetical protein